jgi:hypothetical protein
MTTILRRLAAYWCNCGCGSCYDGRHCGSRKCRGG